MVRKGKLSDDRLRQLAEEGKTAREIAAIIGLNKKIINNQACKAGIKFRKVVARSVAPPPMIDQIAELRDVGKSMSEIGKTLGLSKNAVIGIIHRHMPEYIGDPTKPIRTTLMRLQALHDKMDEVLRQCARSPSHFDKASSLNRVAAEAD
jgi:hypothetical protein